jgi:hypothetical protein
MQDLLEEANRDVITVGTHEDEDDATRVGMHVDIVVIPSMITVSSWVDTTVERPLDETTSSAKRVAVGVCRQAMRK